MPLLDWIDSGINLLGNLFGHDSQDKANRTNIKLQREQQAWEEQMSNTAISRRVADITRAGGNPAAAFVNGGEASTPSVTAARTEPFKPDIRTNFMAAAVNKAQIQNIQADTLEKTASARSKKVEADIREANAGLEDRARSNRLSEQVEWDDRKTSIMRHLDANTAAEAKRQAGTVDAMIQMAKQQTESGKLNLEALRNIATAGGIEANQMAPILKILSSILIKGMED